MLEAILKHLAAMETQLRRQKEKKQKREQKEIEILRSRPESRNEERIIDVWSDKEDRDDARSHNGRRREDRIVQDTDQSGIRLSRGDWLKNSFEELMLQAERIGRIL